MDCQLSYTLNQQTPLIHFQHDQKGATLRATEVKPKLDRFIIEKMGGKENVPASWFIGETNALNYKLRILTTGKPNVSNMIEAEIAWDRAKRQNADKKTKKKLEQDRNAAINGMYFGNMVSGKGEEYEQNVRDQYKETVFYEGNDRIRLEVICFVKALMQEIEKHIEEFFIVTNFGTRQSKGFGGFVALKPGADINLVDPIKILNNNGNLFFYINFAVGTSYSVMLEHAKNIYALMKSGYSYPRRVQGYMLDYFAEDFDSQKEGSDKYLIKKYKGNFWDASQSDDKFVFSRALLGLAEFYEFTEKKGNKTKVRIFSLGEDGFDIERFRSPITIKVVGNKLIFLFGSFDKICGKTFYLAPNGIQREKEFDQQDYKDKKNFILSNPKSFKKIKTPDKFDRKDIIDFINLFVGFFEWLGEDTSEIKGSPVIESLKLRINIPPYLRRKI